MAESKMQAKTAVEYITLNVDTSRVAGGAAWCVKKNGWAYVFLQQMSFRASGDSQSGMITGAPRPLYQVGGVATGTNSSETGDVNRDVAWINGMDDKINFHITYPSRAHWFSLAYPCAE